MSGYYDRTQIDWDRGNGTARALSDDRPAYKISHDNGQTVLKPHSERRKAR